MIIFKPNNAIQMKEDFHKGTKDSNVWIKLTIYNCESANQHTTKLRCKNISAFLNLNDLYIGLVSALHDKTAAYIMKLFEI